VCADPDRVFVSDPGVAVPLANQADAAWGFLLSLRAKARELGIDVDEAWPVDVLERKIAEVGSGWRGLCPSCGSADTDYEAPTRKDWCRACGYEWWITGSRTVKEASGG
jgi:hypothetical protein